MKKVFCAYCGINIADTKDHVPPKCIFPKPRPHNLITVPSCKDCNAGASKDEEYFLSAMMMSDAGITEAGRKHWEKLRKVFARNRGGFHSIRPNLKRVSVYTPSGLYGGESISFKYDDERFREVVTKIAKGLYYFEYETRLPDTAKIMYSFLNTSSKRQIARKYLPETKNGKRAWRGKFEYRHNKLAARNEGSIWLFMFYGVLEFWVVTNS